MANKTRGWERTMPLDNRQCYPGQRVYWIMWCDPHDHSEKRTGWYAYRKGCLPEIWEAVVERTTRNGLIMLEHYGKARLGVYSCPQDAITGTYETICFCYLGGTNWKLPPELSLGEASVILRHLAELEFNLHNAAAKMKNNAN